MHFQAPVSVGKQGRVTVAAEKAMIGEGTADSRDVIQLGGSGV